MPKADLSFLLSNLREWGRFLRESLCLSPDGYEQDTEKAVARHRSAVGRGLSELERKRAEIEDSSCSGCRDDQAAADGTVEAGRSVVTRNVHSAL